MIYIQLVALRHDRIIHHALMKHLLHVIQLYAAGFFNSAFVELCEFFIAVSFLYHLLIVILGSV
jgi:hypothetical protein